MSVDLPHDYIYLMSYAQMYFPDAEILISYSPDEIIYMDVNGRRYTFEIGSDDEEYLFTDGEVSFSIPLMKIDWDF